MRKIRKFEQKLVVIMAMLLISFFVVTTAWATISLFDSTNDFSQSEENMLENAITNPVAGKSRAPEPATIALFGSGLFGMLISFVRRTYAITKRVIDIVLSLIAIIFLSPLFLIIAILVKMTSKGPVFYFQERVGRNGEIFKIYKFRSMRVDAEKGIGAIWAKKNDPRLTLIGGFLRKSHIDEIPQFVNVLRGEMSVIGPRPERPMFVKKLKNEVVDYEKRLAVKPGITGLAQVWHNYDETIADVRKKVKYDLLYIRKLCLWTDLTILLRTVRVVFSGEGAR